MPQESPPNPRPLRRNDVVMERETDGHWSPFGRVWRRHDEHHVEVIDCMKHVTLYREDELVLVQDYQGYIDKGRLTYDRGPDGEILYETGRYEKPRLIRMATLRQLKRMASRYQPHFGGCSHHTREERREALAEPNRYVAPSVLRARQAEKAERKAKRAKAA